ncbi:MAG: hypothetical protein QM770_15790 [Tepidisphaeraceae bacterium]
MHRRAISIAVCLGGALVAALAGCSGRPMLGVGVDANLSSSQPVALNVAASQPVVINGALSLAHPVEITIQGLTIPYEGTFIPEPLFDQIADGDPPDFVAAIFGKPDFESTLSNGSVVWRWKYRPTAQAASLFSLFGSGDRKEPSPDHVSAIVIFKDGKLVRKWRG